MLVAAKYIAIEGVTGVGKTELARLIGEHLDARQVLEEPEENPFLPLFYEEPSHYSFQTQVFFLLSRYRQQQELHQMDLFHSVVVSNYLFARDRIYAHAVLNDDELALYEHLADTLQEQIPRPDLVILLQNSVNHLMQRIRDRGRGYEQVIDEQYLSRLSEAYTHFFFHYSETPLLIVNVSEVDFEGNSEDLRDLLHQIESPPAGTRYYKPVHVGA